MKCPGCGEVNEEGYRFCRVCGCALPVAEDTAATTAFASDLAAAAARGVTAVVTPPPVAPSTYRLVATSGLLSGRTFTVGPKGVVIGRDPSNCQVVVADD
jgi:hypothetical protein